jgi:hypothetical protein
MRDKLDFAHSSGKVELILCRAITYQSNAGVSNPDGNRDLSRRAKPSRTMSHIESAMGRIDNAHSV